MMKVYVFTAHQAVDCEVLEHHTEVFADKEDALARLKEWRDDEMEYVEQREWEVFDDVPDHFEAYEKGYYTTNHVEFTVEECEVQGKPAKEIEAVINKKGRSLDDIVTIVCYNREERMVRRDAIATFYEGMLCCEGAERDRYTNIYQKLVAGLIYCTDD